MRLTANLISVDVFKFSICAPLFVISYKPVTPSAAPLTICNYHDEQLEVHRRKGLLLTMLGGKISWRKKLLFAIVLTFATDHRLYSEGEAETRMKLAQMRRSARVRSQLS